jgi:hypothetical protein
LDFFFLLNADLQEETNTVVINRKIANCYFENIFDVRVNSALDLFFLFRLFSSRLDLISALPASALVEGDNDEVEEDVDGEDDDEREAGEADADDVLSQDWKENGLV